MAVACKVKEGQYESGYGGHNPSPDCTPGEDIVTDDTEESCTDASGSTVALQATADLSAVSGADIWEKIKNYTEWESDFSHSMCNCGPGGCVDERHETVYNDCNVDNITCVCDGALPAALDEIRYGDPVDLDCIYAVGEMAMEFTD
jgi:hypothetical protein